MMTELKPCPFCGGKVSLTEVSFCLELMQFECADCGTIFRMKDDIWNQRVYPPEVEKAIERMEPREIVKTNFGTFDLVSCSGCGHVVSINAKFCSECGQRFDWGE